MWCGAVHWARKWFQDVTIYTDDEGGDLLYRKLGLPFNWVLPLQPLPDPRLARIYELPKLEAVKDHIESTGRPCLHIDHDLYMRKCPPLDAPLLCEQIMEPKEEVTAVHATIPLKRMAVCGKRCSTALFGGTDTAALLAYTTDSLRVAFAPENREFLCGTNGYVASSYLGEAAAFSDFGNRITALPSRRHFVHLGGGKANAGLVAQGMAWVKDDWPEEYAKLHRRWLEIL